MKIALSAFLFALLAAFGASVPRAAVACSYDGDYNPAKSADVIVAGRVTGWEVVDSWKNVDVRTPLVQSSIPIVVHVDVERIVKGSGGSQVDFVDYGSLDVTSGDNMWAAEYAPCGGDFVRDPSGSHIVVGLDLEEDGALRTQNLFFVGESAESYDAAIGHVEDDLSADYTKTLLLVGAAGALALVAIFALTVALRRRRLPD